MPGVVQLNKSTSFEGKNAFQIVKILIYNSNDLTETVLSNSNYGYRVVRK